jgi:alanine racemase
MGKSAARVNFVAVAPNSHFPLPISALSRQLSRAWLEVDLSALHRNAERFARTAGVPILPMVKADAYGLGAVRAARALRDLSWGYGVATVEEGQELREAAIDKPILVFSPILPAQFDAARQAGLRPVLGDRAAIEKWQRTGEPWHLMLDTGMNRAGVPWREIASLHDQLAAGAPEGVCTHFHSSQLPDGSREEQERRFFEAVKGLPVSPRFLHAENSGAVEHHSPSRYTFARPGIFLYGVGSGHGATFEPEPVASVRGRIVEIRVVQQGDSVGYDASWRAPRAGRIATISLGYADGYRRHLGNRAVALLGGKRVPVVGFVTMDMTMIDVTDHRCAVGDLVTLLGRDQDALLTVNDLAAAGGLSPYEVLTGLRSRLPRVYVSDP